MSKEIAKILIDINSINFSFDNHFTLTSGLKSPVYVDCRRIISYAKEREIILNKAISYFNKLNLKPYLPSNKLIQKELEEYELADYIIVPSEFARKTFIEYGILLLYKNLIL